MVLVVRLALVVLAVRASLMAPTPTVLAVATVVPAEMAALLARRPVLVLVARVARVARPGPLVVADSLLPAVTAAMPAAVDPAAGEAPAAGRTEARAVRVAPAQPGPPRGRPRMPVPQPRQRSVRAAGAVTAAPAVPAAAAARAVQELVAPLARAVMLVRVVPVLLVVPR